MVSWLPRFTHRVGEVRLHVPGAFNMMNALGAVAIGDVFGIAFTSMQKTLANFTGIWRRFERVGEYKGAPVISDYAHHPTAIKGTLAAAKEFFPGKRIVALFEPHQHSRTKELFNDFVTSFDDADALILSEPKACSIHASDLVLAEEMLRDLVTEHDVVLIMGAGNVDTVARNLVRK
jgi:UDP-N-acetylmuramate--alanine ligase